MGLFTPVERLELRLKYLQLFDRATTEESDILVENLIIADMEARVGWEQILQGIHEIGLIGDPNDADGLSASDLRQYLRLAMRTNKKTEEKTMGWGLNITQTAKKNLENGSWTKEGVVELFLQNAKYIEGEAAYDRADLLGVLPLIGADILNKVQKEHGQQVALFTHRAPTASTVISEWLQMQSNAGGGQTPAPIQEEGWDYLPKGLVGDFLTGDWNRGELFWLSHELSELYIAPRALEHAKKNNTICVYMRNTGDGSGLDVDAIAYKEKCKVRLVWLKQHYTHIIGLMFADDSKDVTSKHQDILTGYAHGLIDNFDDLVSAWIPFLEPDEVGNMQKVHAVSSYVAVESKKPVGCHTWPIYQQGRVQHSYWQRNFFQGCQFVAGQIIDPSSAPPPRVVGQACGEICSMLRKAGLGFFAMEYGKNHHGPYIIEACQNMPNFMGVGDGI